MPNSITHLTFGNDFNRSVNNLPNNLTHLTFAKFFDKPVNKLPNSITHLSINSDFFDKPINKLPILISHLTITSHYFNNSIAKLPNSITHLTINCRGFNQKIKKLPDSIIEFGFDSYSKIKNCVPENIENIIIYFDDDNKYNQIINNLPLGVKNIKINNVNKKHYLNKVPFGTIVMDIDNNIIDL